MRDGLSSFAALLVVSLSKTGGLAGSLAQIVDLLPSDFAVLEYLNRSDERRIVREVSLNADAIRNLSDDEGLRDTTSANRDDHAFKDLDTRLIAFDDTHRDFDSITSYEVRKIRSELAGCNLFSQIAIHALDILLWIELYSTFTDVSSPAERPGPWKVSRIKNTTLKA